MTILTASFLHWAASSLIAAVAVALILVARAMPSQPTQRRVRTAQSTVASGDNYRL
jgi:hypothetical protein